MEELLVVRLFCERITPRNGAIWANTNRSDLSAVVKLPTARRARAVDNGSGRKKRVGEKETYFRVSLSDDI